VTGGAFRHTARLLRSLVSRGAIWANLMLSKPQNPVFKNNSMDIHSIIVVSLHSPKEKVWGELMAINQAGITVRGIDLNSFDHFVRAINEPDGERVGFPTIFFPMNRVERLSLDESSGSIPSMAELFTRKVGRTLPDYLAQFA
jgi:hypothetical protein